MGEGVRVSGGVDVAVARAAAWAGRVKHLTQRRKGAKTRRKPGQGENFRFEI